LLAAVDVVGCARQGRARHNVYDERGDVGRSDDAPDGQRGAKLAAAAFEFNAEERCGQRRIDEAGSDKVNPNRRHFNRQVRDQGGQRGRARRGIDCSGFSPCSR